MNRKDKHKIIGYKGFTINCSREASLGGEQLTYYHIIDSEGVFVVDTFTTGTTPFGKFCNELKEVVDDIIENPEEYYED